MLGSLIWNIATDYKFHPTLELDVFYCIIESCDEVCMFLTEYFMSNWQQHFRMSEIYPDLSMGP